MIEVFSTARQVRNFYNSFVSSDTFLPKAITISEFETKAWILPDLIQADEDTRVFLMRQSAQFHNFDKLGIPQEFMAFLKNSDYLFNFFEELANEEADIDTLDLNDTYAEFSEHISILKELLQRYSDSLLQRGLFDKITKPKTAQLNTVFLESLGEIRLHVEGFLSHFEMRLLNEAKQFCQIFIQTPINDYNKKIVEWINSEGIATEPNTLIEFCLNDGSLVKKEKLYRAEPHISYEKFSTRALQSAFIFQKIEEFADSGIKAENIAVILPDENFAPILKELDRFGNLNFAMGFSMDRSAYFHRLSAVLDYFKNNEKEHESRLARLGLKNHDTLDLQAATEEIMAFLASFENENDPIDESDIVKNELFLFEKFLQNIDDITYEQAGVLFLQRLKRKRTDDKTGGKVTVMGVLESRGARYDGVIIVDFNDDIVPKRSDKDMFISSRVRSNAALPVAEDRENLQRFFYDRLIRNSKMTAISSVDNENKIPSRFLNSLPFKTENKSETSYKDIILEPFFIAKNEHPITAVKHDFFEKPLSSTRLSTYLKCKRKYYFAYVKNYKEPESLRDENDARAVGTFIHDILQKLFTKKPTTATALKQEFKRLMKEDCKNTKMEFQGDIWSLRLEDFFENEIKHFRAGWEVVALEKEIERQINGVTIKGKIDRIDKNGNDFLLIDYKTGRFEEEKTAKKALESDNFQLAFYSFLYDFPSSAAFYDLKNGKFIKEQFLEVKKERLKNYIDDLKNIKEFDFEMREDYKMCIYCPFAKLCGRTL